MTKKKPKAGRSKKKSMASGAYDLHFVSKDAQKAHGQGDYLQYRWMTQAALQHSNLKDKERGAAEASLAYFGWDPTIRWVFIASLSLYFVGWAYALLSG